MTLSTSLLLLLLLGLCQAHPFLEEGEEEEEPDAGDITNTILGSNTDIDDMLLEGDLLTPKTKNAIKCWNQQCRWEKASNGSVMVPFTLSSDFTSSDKAKINKAMQVYHDSTCIRFFPRQKESDYISIENKGGCYSHLGRVGGKQLLSLKKTGCLAQGVIQHELNHALGFQHEQCRSDRDTHIRINWNNIKSGKTHNFDKHPTDNLNTPYDYNSIMHYGRWAFSINRRSETITPIPNRSVYIGQRRDMSFWDIDRVNLLYGCV
ncbi:high choriolytic enzyme 1-like [Brachionichthys hirsutus]|uniref:high choriolytic enzyme 1-like n=1 Tax=Brachionichthys hirsutus TaxID=412623 RepID=UPI0036050CB4